MGLSYVKLIFGLLLMIGSAFADLRLQVAGKDSSLEEVVVEAELHGRFLTRHLTLTFHNEGSRSAEGDLTCPLDVGEKIVSFAMDVNGVRREGVVVPKKRGKFAYETIVSRGVDPGLIEVDEVTNEFRTRVFPIPRNGNKTVWITTVQVVEAGEIRVWPKGLGNPKKWSLSLETAGGEAGDFQSEQSGDATTVPVGSVSWMPTPDLAYRSDHGDLSFAKKKPTVFKAASLEVWVDGTAEVAPAARERLVELLSHYQNAKVTLRVFSGEVEEPREFALVDGIAPDFVKAMSDFHRSGMARPRGLPWKTVHADAVIFVTDGAFVSGRAGVGETACPLHVIDTGKGTSRWLRAQALHSGGGWHRPAELDPMMGAITPGSTMVGEVMGEWLFMKPRPDALKTPIANWLWANLKMQEMRNGGVNRKEIDDFKFEHRVMDSESSMIVMETARQYQEFQIEPPKDDAVLYEAWELLQEKGKEVQGEWMDQLAELWEKRCERLATPVPALSERVLARVKGRMDQLESLVTNLKKVKLATVHPLMTELLAIEALVDGGIADSEIAELKKLMASLTSLEGEMKLENAWIEITVGGQVNEPGRKLLPIGSTLYEAVQAAGGPTAFGAINRVKLFRNGKVYTYNLKMDSHKTVRVYPNDFVEMPQKQWFGNGGGGGKKTSPFGEKALAAIAFQKGDEQAPKYYLEALAKVIDDEKKWVTHYRTYRAACGWRADFYLNLINLLEDRGEKEKALRVAGDLAEHLPENLEILRRAARAFRRLGDLATAHELFEHLYAMQPDDAMAMYDLARVKQGRGEMKEAVVLFWKAVQITQSKYSRGREIVILEELNALLAKEKLDAAEFGIDLRFVKHVPVELRAVLEWDAKQSNLDLIVRDPAGGWSTGFFGEEFASSSWWSGNVSSGYGPEGWALQGLIPGTYHFGARFFGDWNDDGKSTATAEIEFTRNFGTPEETRERRALRIEEKTHSEIMKVTVTPEGWE